MNQEGIPIAAIDLGSNSFHMVIAIEYGHNIKIIDRVKEMVRLNEGLDEHHRLSDAVQRRALDCLNRFKQRAAAIPNERIRIVGTNTLRAAHNAGEFIDKAEAVLGRKISIISGHEEARLIFIGAEFGLASNGKKRLVIDIGGGSTELIIGTGNQPQLMDSLYMGCVSMTKRFFDDGNITQQAIDQARDYANRELEPLIQHYTESRWNNVVGTSGTIKAIMKLSRQLGIDDDYLTNDCFNQIQHWLVEAQHVKNLDLISEERRPVFIGGFSILSSIFDLFSINQLELSDGALREGVMLELLDRLHDLDSREGGVSRIMSQFNVDTVQAVRVKKTAMQIYSQVVDNWTLTQDIYSKLLKWSADVHEIGQSVSYNQYHKHGQYILANTNIDGFSRLIQRVLSIIVRSHRQKFGMSEIESLPTAWQKPTLYLSVILRISVAINRNRQQQPTEGIWFEADHHALHIHTTQQWEAEHPMTVTDFKIEQELLKSIGFMLHLHFDHVSRTRTVCRH